MYYALYNYGIQDTITCGLGPGIGIVNYNSMAQGKLGNIAVQIFLLATFSKIGQTRKHLRKHPVFQMFLQHCFPVCPTQ